MNEGDRQKLNNFIFAVAAGDTGGLDGIYNIAAKRMLIAAYTVTGEKSTAEDIVSESFIKIARFAKRYRNDGEPMAWILRIVRNTALDYLRKQKRRPQSSTDEFFSLADESYSPEKRETAIMLEQAISKLEPPERQAIRMRYFLDMTVRETAAAMKLSRSSAQRLIERAEEKLKSLLNGGTNAE